MHGVNEDAYWLGYQARVEGWNEEDDYDNGSVDNEIDEIILERKERERDE